MRQVRELITISCWVSSVSFSSIFFWSCCSCFSLFLSLSWHSFRFLKYPRISSFRAACSLSSSSCCLQLFFKSCSGKQKHVAGGAGKRNQPQRFGFERTELVTGSLRVPSTPARHRGADKKPEGAAGWLFLNYILPEKQ